MFFEIFFTNPCRFECQLPSPGSDLSEVVSELHVPSSVMKFMACRLFTELWLGHDYLL